MEGMINLLLVEDNPGDGELIQRILSKDTTVSYAVNHQFTLQAAIESLRTHLADILLLDLNLPDSTGLETVRNLNAEGFDIPVIAMTGNTDNELGYLAIQSGAQDFVAKTTENFALLSRIISLNLERFRMFTALQKSEARYRMLSEVSSDYMFSSHIEPDGSIVQDWTTGAIEEITGYPLDEYLEIGGWPAIVHPDDRWIDDRDMQTLHRNEKIHTELRIRRKDGKTAWVQVKGIPLWDEENNKLGGICGSTLDISQQKLNEMALIGSELRFKTMFAQAPMGIGLTDANTGQYVNVNKYFADLVGRSPDELTTMKWMEITHPDDIDLDLGHMRRLNAGEIDAFQIEKRYLHKNGSIIWVSMKVTPITVDDSNRYYVISMVEDITEQKKQQEQLAESETRFRLLYENTPMGIVLIDWATGKFHQVNQYFADLVGYSVDDLESIQWTQITHPDDIGTHAEEMDLLLTGKINHFHMEKRLFHANGSTIWVDIQQASMGTLSGGDPLTLSMVEDITERKRHQQQLTESENRFRLLYEQAPLPYQSLDKDGMLLEVNDAWLNELGYQKSEVVGRYFADFLSDQDSELFPTKFENFKKIGEVHGIEYKMLHKDQSLVDVSFDGRIVRDQNDHFIQTHCVFTNITERARLQNALESRLVALTRPLDQAYALSFTDLFDLEQIQQLQDEFANATGVASVITHTDGTPITQPSNFCRLCNDIIRGTEKGRLNCFKSDAALGSYHPEGPIVVPCLSGGLWDAGASISVGGQHIANWLIGQVRDETQNEEMLRGYAKKIGVDENEAIEAFREVPIMSQSKFRDVAQMLFTISNQLSDMAYQNAQQARFISDLKQAEYEQERNLSRLESLTSILQYPYENQQDFLDFSLNEAIQLTESKIGYIYFYNEETKEFTLNTWSKEVMAECRVAEPQTRYQLEKTGIWGEAVRQRKTIIVNDFQASNRMKKGYPEGHVHLKNFMTLPIFGGDQIVATVGVGNKETDYDHQDELQLTLLMNNVWKVVERSRALEQLTRVSLRMQHHVDSSPIILFAHELNENSTRMIWCSDNAESFLGFSREEIDTPQWWYRNKVDEDVLSLEDIRNWDQPGQDLFEQDYRFKNKAGDILWINERIKLLRDADGKPIECILAWADITARKQMEENAIINSAQLETALSNMADAVYITDAQGNITHFNESTATFYKFQSKENCAKHFSDWGSIVEVMTKDGVLISRENWSIHRALRGEKQSNIEYFFRRTDTGETWYGNYNFAPIRDEEGEIIGSVVTARDITEQKQLLESLRQSTEDLNKAQSVAHVGSWKWHILSNHLTWSDEMYAIFGIDKTSFTGKLSDVIASAIHPEDRAAVEASNLSVLQENKPIPLEYRVIRPDGTLRTVWAEAGELVFDNEGKPQELTGIVQDITERKATQAQLLLKDAALNSAANSIVITDLEGTIQWANPAFCELTGYSAHEAIGANPRDLVSSGFHDAAFYQNLWDTILSGDLWQGELTNRRKDGSQYDEQMTITPIKDARGNVTNFIAIKEDISLRKQHEYSIQNHMKIQENLVAMGRTFSTLIDVQMIYRTAYRYIREIIDIPNFGITLIDPDDQHLHLVFAISDKVNMDVSLFPRFPYTPDNPTTDRSRVIANRTTIITNAVEEKTKASGGMFIGSTGLIPQSAIFVPMIAEGKSIGVLELQSYQKNAFSPETSEWLEVVANQVALAIQNTRLYEQIRKRVSQLSGLREIDTAINGHQPLSTVYEMVLSQIRFHLKVDAADILMLSVQDQELIYQAGYGFETIDPAQIKIPFGYGVAGAVLESGKQIQHNGSDMFDIVLEECEKWTKENFRAYIGMPIIVDNMAVGVLEVFHRSQLSAQPEWLQYMETLAGQAAIAIENNDLINNLQQTAKDLVLAYDATIEGWSQAMDLRDRETEGHTQRVTNLTEQFAKAAGVPDDQMIHFRRGALLHDIGKLGVPDYILRKPGALDDEEWAIMKQHPQFAYDMLHQVDYLKPALDIPLYHHEKWDGSGYPEGLSGEDIPLSARIFAFVDVWDAVTNDRPYKKAWSKEEALQLIKDGAGSHFDPELTQLFVTIIDMMDS